MKKLMILMVICLMSGCSDSTGPESDGNDDQPFVIEPDPYEWVPIFRFDGSASAFCYPDEPSQENDGSCVAVFNPDAPVYWEGQWCSSNSYKLAFWVWYGWQQECIIGQGSHANDWEHVILNFNYTTATSFTLESVTFYQHQGWYTRWQYSGPVNVWVGKIGHGSYHCYCDGTGFLWEVTYCQGGCGYWDDFRNDTYGIQWKPTNLVSLDVAKSIEGPIGERVKYQDYCNIPQCEGSTDRILGTAGCWQNNYLLWPTSQATSILDWAFLYECSGYPLCSAQDNSRAITSIFSYHNNDCEDRSWTFACSDLPGGPSVCGWTGFLNIWDQEFTYVAPADCFISGFASVHHNDYEDRIWKVKICRQESKCCTAGEWTDFLNAFDGVLNLQTGGKVICGVASYHNNDHEDRQWRFLLCDLVDCD